MLFDETYFKESTINLKPLIWSQDMTITKFGHKKRGDFCFAQSVQKLPKKLEKMLFYETFFEKSNINWKPLIWYRDKIITKFG